MCCVRACSDVVADEESTYQLCDDAQAHVEVLRAHASLARTFDGLAGLLEGGLQTHAQEETVVIAIIAVTSSAYTWREGVQTCIAILRGRLAESGLNDVVLEGRQRQVVVIMSGADEERVQVVREWFMNFDFESLDCKVVM